MTAIFFCWLCENKKFCFQEENPEIFYKEKRKGTHPNRLPPMTPHQSTGIKSDSLCSVFRSQEENSNNKREIMRNGRENGGKWE